MHRLAVVPLALGSLLASLIGCIRGIELGLDFEGGIELGYAYADSASHEEVEEAVARTIASVDGGHSCNVVAAHSSLRIQCRNMTPEALDQIRSTLRPRTFGMHAILDEEELAESRLVAGEGERLLEESPGESSWGSPKRFLVGAAELRGAEINEAWAQPSEFDQSWVVLIQFTPSGARRLAELTTRIVDRKLAIVLDDTVLSAPVVSEPITGGRAMITLGSGDGRLEAEALALRLRSASLPSLVPETEYQIAPAYGGDARTLALAAYYSFLALGVFGALLAFAIPRRPLLPIAIGGAGLAASVALYSGLDAVWTLPAVIAFGIGGLVPAAASLPWIGKTPAGWARLLRAVPGFVLIFAVGVGGIIAREITSGPWRGFWTAIMIGAGGALFAYVIALPMLAVPPHVTASAGSVPASPSSGG